MAGIEKKVEEQAEKVAEFVSSAVKPSFWQKYKLALIAAGSFALGMAADAVRTGFVQQKRLNLIESNDPLVEIGEPIE